MMMSNGMIVNIVTKVIFNHCGKSISRKGNAIAADDINAMESIVMIAAMIIDGFIL